MKLLAIFFTFILAANGSLWATPSKSGPNIIFILTDDLGWGDLGVFYQNSKEGDKNLATPQLDKMAREGIQMRRHYCPAPVCAPSRASLLTGLHQGHADVRDNQFDKALPDNHTLGTVLQAAGYHTALIGKYGLQGGPKEGTLEDWTAYPTDRGFDDFFGLVSHTAGHLHYPAHNWPLGDTERHSVPMQFWHNDKEISASLKKCYTTDLFTAFAKKWIVEHRERNPQQPFFVYLAYDTPHAALQLPTRAYPKGGGLKGGVKWLGKRNKMINTAVGKIDSWIHPDYRNRGYSNVEERFATMTRRIDSCVGDLLKLLRDLDIDEETLVVFTSDNGPHKESYLKDELYRPTSFRSYGPYDGIKRDLWEGGIRMPSLAWWPGSIPAGRIDHAPSQFHDWLNTFVDLAGEPQLAMSDGVSLSPTLTGLGLQEPGQVYIEYYNKRSTPTYEDFDKSHRGRPRLQMQALFLNGYKGVRMDIQGHQDAFEIYDVENDPQETRNLAGSSPYFEKLQQRMKDHILRIRRPNMSAPRPYDEEAVPAVALSNAARGLRWRAYSGNFPWVPKLSATRPERIGVSNGFDLDAVDLSVAGAVIFEGYIRIPRTGDYVFSLKTTSGAIMRIHDAIVIDADYAYKSGQVVTASIRLEEGFHPIRLHLLAGDDLELELKWSGPEIGEDVMALTELYYER